MDRIGVAARQEEAHKSSGDNVASMWVQLKRWCVSCVWMLQRGHSGDVRNILLLPLVARCLEIIDVCIWRMFVFLSVVVTVWGSVGMFVV